MLMKFLNTKRFDFEQASMSAGWIQELEAFDNEEHHDEDGHEEYNHEHHDHEEHDHRS